MYVIPQLQASMANYEANELIKKYDSNKDGVFNHVAQGSTEFNKQGTVSKNPKANDDVLHKLGSNAHIKPKEQFGGKVLQSSKKVLHVKTSNMPLSREQMKEIFKYHDSNNDGFLNVWELTKAFGFLGSIIPFYKAHYGLVHADANKDGLISEDELEQLIDYAINFINKK